MVFCGVPQVAALPHAVMQHAVTVELHTAGRWIENAADDIEKRDLAGAGRLEQGHDLARKYVERDIPQRVHARRARANVL